MLGISSQGNVAVAVTFRHGGRHQGIEEMLQSVSYGSLSAARGTRMHVGTYV